jgi:hypothetical protein
VRQFNSYRNLPFVDTVFGVPPEDVKHWPHPIAPDPLRTGQAQRYNLFEIVKVQRCQALAGRNAQLRDGNGVIPVLFLNQNLVPRLRFELSQLLADFMQYGLPYQVPTERVL